MVGEASSNVPLAADHRSTGLSVDKTTYNARIVMRSAIMLRTHMYIDRVCCQLKTVYAEGIEWLITTYKRPTLALNLVINALVNDTFQVTTDQGDNS